MIPNQIIEQWIIPNSKGNYFTVCLDREGNYSCNCKSKKCKHITFVLENNALTKTNALLAKIAGRKIPSLENPYTDTRDM